MQNKPARSTGPVRPSESELQKAIVEELTWRGFVVCHTDRRRKQCARCGEVSHAGDGVARGLPDLFVTHESWPSLLWLAIELKRDERSRIRPEQLALSEMRRVQIVCDHDDAIALVLRYHGQLRDAIRPPCYIGGKIL